MTHLKRLGALSLSLALTLTALSGCQNGASSSSQGDEPIDLASVTDPYLTTAGLSGDTVVARAGGADITAGSLLYWMAYLVDSSIRTRPPWTPSGSWIWATARPLNRVSWTPP